MKNNYLAVLPLFLLLLLDFNTVAQVGINTTEPTSTLDVNGAIRVRNIVDGQTDVKAVKIIGIDEFGNFIKVDVDKNIDLIDNKLVVTNRTLEMGSLPSPFITTQNHNVNLRVLPGAANHGKSIIRIESTVGDIEITGIEAAPDGTHIWLYAVSGRIRLIDNSVQSLPGNRIERNDKMGCKQYEMIELVYDGTRGIWIIMQNNS